MNPMSLNICLYPLDMTTIKDKISIICKEIYGAQDITYSELAEKRIAVSTCY